MSAKRWAAFGHRFICSRFNWKFGIECAERELRHEDIQLNSRPNGLDDGRRPLDLRLIKPTDPAVCLDMSTWVQ